MTEYVTKAPAEERPFAVLYSDLAPGETVTETTTGIMTTLGSLARFAD